MWSLWSIGITIFVLPSDNVGAVNDRTGSDSEDDYSDSECQAALSVAIRSCESAVVAKNEAQAGATSVRSDSPWIRRLLSDSIYLWACGEKAGDGDEEPTLSDRLIGWLILFMQGFAYITIIILIGNTSNSDTDASRESSYLLASVTGAMYLLVASTTHDLRAGFSLSVNGSCAGHRAFGIGLLIVYGTMTTAAMTVIVSTSDNSASLVLNAVTVVFIADLDEKVLKFLSTIPQKWRLFWAIESIGISFALALIAIICMGDSSPLLKRNNGILKQSATWWIWWFNPAAVTVASVVLNFAITAVCNFCTETCIRADEPTVGVQDTRAFMRFFVAVKKSKERLKEEPFFFATLALWLAQAVRRWFLLMANRGFPLAFGFTRTTVGSGDLRVVLTDQKLVLMFSNAILASGLAAKALGFIRRNHEAVPRFSGSRYFPGGCGLRETWGSCGDSRVPPLLIGWGIEYWFISLLYLLASSWHGSGWNNAPSAVTVVAYIVIPSFLLLCVFMVADTNFLGKRFEVFVKPATDRMRNRRRTEYWVMATVFRDFLVVWTDFCISLSQV